MKYYVLEGKTPKPCSMQEAMNAIGNKKMRRVAADVAGDVLVSTVFLTIDHNWSGRGKPLLFETMVFGGDFDERQWRYHTWDEAEAGHQQVLEMVKLTSKSWRWSSSGLMERLK